MNSLFEKICPPVLFSLLKRINAKRKKLFVHQAPRQVLSTDKQDLDMYWDADMAALLETWGKDHVWNEFQMFLSDKEGKVLDIACGTGITIQLAAQNKNIRVYGCDISDFLIKKASERGISNDVLEVCDATDMKVYSDNFFDYSYSIGSLEHFTEEGILQFVSEVHRITKHSSIHMMPVSRNEMNNGWVKLQQSYFNNNVEWWVDRFKTKYDEIHVIDSGWKDDISVGKWFICLKNE